MKELVEVIETVLANLQAPLEADVNRRRELAASIASVWADAGGTREGVEPFVNYWMTVRRDMRQLLLERRASARRAMASLRVDPQAGDTA